MGTSYWLSAAAYLVPTFPLGYFWHLTTFKTQYDRLEAYRPDVLIPFGLTSMLIQALLFAWLYPHLFNTARANWLLSAAQFAGIFGLLAWSLAVLPVAAKYRMTSVSRFVKLETAFTFVHYVIVSPLIALAWRNPA